MSSLLLSRKQPESESEYKSLNIQSKNDRIIMESYILRDINLYINGAFIQISDGKFKNYTIDNYIEFIYNIEYTITKYTGLTINDIIRDYRTLFPELFLILNYELDLFKKYVILLEYVNFYNKNLNKDKNEIIFKSKDFDFFRKIIGLNTIIYANTDMNYVLNIFFSKYINKYSDLDIKDIVKYYDDDADNYYINKNIYVEELLLRYFEIANEKLNDKSLLHTKIIEYNFKNVIKNFLIDFINNDYKNIITIFDNSVNIENINYFLINKKNFDILFYNYLKYCELILIKKDYNDIINSFITIFDKYYMNTLIETILDYIETTYRDGKIKYNIPDDINKLEKLLNNHKKIYYLFYILNQLNQSKYNIRYLNVEENYKLILEKYINNNYIFPNKYDYKIVNILESVIDISDLFSESFKFKLGFLAMIYINTITIDITEKNESIEIFNKLFSLSSINSFTIKYTEYLKIKANEIYTNINEKYIYELDDLSNEIKIHTDLLKSNKKKITNIYNNLIYLKYYIRLNILYEFFKNPTDLNNIDSINSLKKLYSIKTLNYLKEQDDNIQENRKLFKYIFIDIFKYYNNKVIGFDDNNKSYHLTTHINPFYRNGIISEDIIILELYEILKKYNDNLKINIEIESTNKNIFNTLLKNILDILIEDIKNYNILNNSDNILYNPEFSTRTKLDEFFYNLKILYDTVALYIKETGLSDIYRDFNIEISNFLRDLKSYLTVNLIKIPYNDYNMKLLEYYINFYLNNDEKQLEELKYFYKNFLDNNSDNLYYFIKLYINNFKALKAGDELIKSLEDNLKKLSDKFIQETTRVSGGRKNKPKKLKYKRILKKY